MAEIAADGVKTADYFYGPLNRRVKKHLTSGDDVVYLYDGWQCIEERRLDEDVWATDREHIYGGQYIDEIAATYESGSLTYYLHDTNYNVIAIAHDSGVVQERYWYKPYGSVNFAAPDGTPRTEANAVNTTLLFQSRRYDTETGFYYFRNRFYSPVLGRFLQRDPAGYQDGMNLYLAFISDPMLGSDPNGLSKLSEKIDELKEEGYEEEYKIRMDKLLSRLGGFKSPWDEGIDPEFNIPGKLLVMVGANKDDAYIAGGGYELPIRLGPVETELSARKYLLEDRESYGWKGSGQLSETVRISGNVTLDEPGGVATTARIGFKTSDTTELGTYVNNSYPEVSGGVDFRKRFSLFGREFESVSKAGLDEKGGPVGETTVKLEDAVGLGRIKLGPEAGVEYEDGKIKAKISLGVSWDF